MGRGFSFLDTVYINDLYHLLKDSYGNTPAVIVLTVLIIVPAGLLIVNYLVYRELGKFWIHSKLSKYTLLFVIAALIIIGSLSFLNTEAIWSPALKDLKNIVTLQNRKKEISLNLDNEASRRIETITNQIEITAPLDKLNNVNVFVFIVESYGRTFFDNPENWEVAEPQYRIFEKKLFDAGYSIASSSLISPAIGGNSWLADSTFNSGVWVKNQTVYNELIISKVPVLGTFFKDAGYKTIVAQAGMRNSGDEKYFYNFDKTYNFSDFGYKGPSFVWATMPDQYILNFINQHEVEGKNYPVFIEYILISSHFPFQKIPAYIKDWNKLGNGTIYNGKGMVKTLPIPEGRKTAGPFGFTKSILYVMKVLTDYISTQLKNPSLIIILGDHQPYTKVTGPYGGRQVALHIISKDSSLIGPFLNRGYTKGLTAPSTDSAPGMDTFLSTFINIFSSVPVF